MDISCLIFLLIFLSKSLGYLINIDANEEQCFFDRVVSGTKMGLMFEVAEGGFLDIDVKVYYYLSINLLVKASSNKKKRLPLYVFIICICSCDMTIKLLRLGGFKGL